MTDRRENPTSDLGRAAAIGLAIQASYVVDVEEKAANIHLRLLAEQAGRSLDEHAAARLASKALEAIELRQLAADRKRRSVRWPSKLIGVLAPL